MVDYKITNPYMLRVEDIEFKSSTSADGWKYHKPSKKRKKK